MDTAMNYLILFVIALSLCGCEQMKEYGALQLGMPLARKYPDGTIAFGADFKDANTMVLIKDGQIFACLDFRNGPRYCGILKDMHR